MKTANLNIKQKMLLLIIFLISLVSSLIIIANNKLTDKSRGVIQAEISGNIAEIQRLSEHEFTAFKGIANDGIVAASGMAAIENIVSIALGHQKEFYNVIQEELGKVGGEVDATLNDQHKMVGMSLKRLLNDSTVLIDEIIDFDNRSLSVLSNVAIFNVDSLKEASHESQEIFSRNIDQIDHILEQMQGKNKHEIDDLLAETIVASWTTAHGVPCPAFWGAQGLFE